MNPKNLLAALLLGTGMCANAANTITEVTQVTDAVALTNDVDYTITSDTPFATAGSVDIVNTEHAVLIFANIKPSKVLASYMGNIAINGEAAKNGVNCRVQMYGTGAIVFPYGKDHKGLTVYDEQNFGGEACDNYAIGHTGGYMKTLTANTFNNKIRSFRLKRGYMVTFAVGTGGWGYSRCFIADKEDLEVKSLPAILDQRISSYRLFHWYNVQKKGIASTGAKDINDALNTSWCYDWAAGNADRLPDQEWVPNHIYEDWPSSAAIGGVSQSCHTKNNNEPANSADDHPQDVKTVLDNWENMMRTGLRLCSPATHDGGWGWHHDFMNEIDARGWRCDIVDFHGYWGTGTWNSLDWMIDTYAHGRPVWFSEWVWGSSWGNQGIFAECPDGRESWSKANQQKCYDGTKPILDRLNSNTRVERYAYWNGEAPCSRIYQNGEFSVLGKYYAEMNSGFAYNPKNEFVPRETRLEDLSMGDLTYDRKTGKVTLTWADPNGDLMTTIEVQRKGQGDALFKTVGTVEPKDKASREGASYTYSETLTEPGVYQYRVKATSYNNKSFTTDERTVNVAPAQGTSEVQYGKLSISDAKANEVYFSESFSEAPCVFIGTVTYKNSKFSFGNNLSVSDKSKFSFQMLPWLTNTGEVEKNEEVPFLALKAGNYKFGDMQCEVGVSKSAKASANLWSDETEVTFAQPFAEGVTPIVLTEIKKPGYSTKTALSVRVFDVTNTGFKYIVYSEDKAQLKVALQQNVNYLAIAPGFAYADQENGIMIAAGQGSSQIYGLTAQELAFTVGDEALSLYSPVVLTALQTNNYPASCVLRRTDVTTKDDAGTTWTTGTKVKRTPDHALTVDGKTVQTSTTAEAYRDDAGWVVVANYREGGSKPAGAIDTGIADINATAGSLCVCVVDRAIRVTGAAKYEIRNMSGMLMPANTPLAVGVYVVTAGKESVKVVVK